MSDEKDADVTNDEKTTSYSFAGIGVSSEVGEDSTTRAVTVGGYGALSYGGSDDLSGGVNSVAKLVDLGNKAAHGDGEAAGIAEAAAAVADITLNGFAYVADPLNFLISAGLTFLVDVVQPLQDLIGLVSGNSERMGGEAEKWHRVADALGPLAQEIRDASDQELIGWSGKAADAAKTRLHELADGIASLSHDVLQLKTILDLTGALMSAAEALIIGIIATLVEWLVLTWVPALAAAAPTLGGSTAAAAAATTAEGAVAMSRAAMFIQRVMRVLHKLQTLIERIHPKITTKMYTEFSMLTATGGVVPTPQTVRQFVGNPLADFMGTQLPLALGASLTGAADGIEQGMNDAPDLSGAEQRRALDPNR